MLEKYKSKIERARGSRKLLEQQHKQAKKALRNAKRDLVNSEQALLVVQEVAQKTLKELEYRIGEVVSLALSAVFDEPYKLVLVSSIKRGRTEFSLLFERDGEQVRPYDSSGGGAVDIASFALRIALWSLKNPRTRNTIILDEPMKMISEDLRDKTSQMIKEISSRLNLQIIMVTHSSTIADCADRVFEVRQTRGISKVRLLNA